MTTTSNSNKVITGMKRPKMSIPEKITNSKLIAKLDRLDKKLSAKIHNLSVPKFLQPYLLFFGLICNKEGPFFILMSVTFLLPLLEPTPKPYYSLNYGLQYFA